MQTLRRILFGLVALMLVVRFVQTAEISTRTGVLQSPSDLMVVLDAGDCRLFAKRVILSPAGHGAYRMYIGEVVAPRRTIAEFWDIVADDDRATPATIRFELGDRVSRQFNGTILVHGRVADAQVFEPDEPWDAVYDTTLIGILADDPMSPD